MRFSLSSKLYAIAAAALCGVVALGLWWQRREFPVILNLLSEDTQLFLKKTLFDVGGQPVRILFVIKTALFLLFLHLIARLARNLLSLVGLNDDHLDKHRQYLISRTVTFLIYVVGILIGIHVERINFTTIAVIGGTLGLGVGFGLQSLVSNFISGIILLTEQPIRLGDRIELGERTGEVVRIGSRSSSVRTYDNALLIIPNSDFVTKQILNWTIIDPKTRLSLSVSVAYDSNPQEVIQNLVELAKSHPEVMTDPAPYAVLTELGSSALTFSLRIWTITPAEKFPRLRSDLYVAILQRFQEKHIAVPYPQLDLHLKSQEVDQQKNKG